MSKEPTTSRPSHRVYAVIKKNGEKAHWAEIGATWPNKDGKGFSMKLYTLPIDPNAEFVIREATEEGQGGRS